MEELKIYVISYDVRDDKRRRRIVKVLEDYGVRVQFSVFEAELKTSDLLLLRRKVESILSEEDSIIFYSLCGRCYGQVQRIGDSMAPFGSPLKLIIAEY